MEAECCTGKVQRQLSESHNPPVVQRQIALTICAIAVTFCSQRTNANVSQNRPARARLRLLRV